MSRLDARRMTRLPARPRFVVLVILLLSGVTAWGRSEAASHVNGVPFVSWREAAGMNYEHRDIMNPSVHAAEEMVLRFHLNRLEAGVNRESMRSILADSLYSGTNRVGTTEGLRQAITAGIPVLVALSFTPQSHPLPNFVEVGVAMGLLKDVDLGEAGPTSGMLGRLVATSKIPGLPEQARRSVQRESMHLAWRVVVGFDDDRSSIVLHDPSFGPGFELPTSEFEAMWTVMGRVGHALLSDASPLTESTAAGSSGVAAPANPLPPRPRTAEEIAAWHYARGYALASIHRLEDADVEFARGLTGADPESGMRHLLLVERAICASARGRHQEAVSMAQEAVSLLPDNPQAWDILAKAGQRAGGVHGKAAKDAEKRAKNLRKDSEALARLARSLPCPFYLAALAKLRGWCSD